jgi:hypothetical protein
MNSLLRFEQPAQNRTNFLGVLRAIARSRSAHFSRIDSFDVAAGIINSRLFPCCSYKVGMKTNPSAARSSLEHHLPRIIALGLLAAILFFILTGCQETPP